ncbi:MAG: metallophosphoesterase [Candidatus ainarchaeum sp.]|nr:metallophosphoesterase [Candidatus ainarchaeum sp.]
MKIAIFSDTHLGYARFEEDSYVQAGRVLADAAAKADLILCAGDVFDTKIPKLETLSQAIGIFRSVKAPVYLIYGNHERRSRDMTNPVELLATAADLTLLDGSGATFEKGGERVQVFGMGSVPEEYAEKELKAALEKFRPEEGAFKTLMLHQSVKELVPGGKDELSLKFLEPLPFDLIVNGHIHNTIVKLGGRFLIPGSTVITQLKKDETDPKGYFLYDTKTRKAEFVKIESRAFFYEELHFRDAGDSEIREGIRARLDALRKAHPNAIISIKLEGTLKPGLNGSDIKLERHDNVYIENLLNIESLGARLEKIRDLRQENLSVRDLALKELSKKIEGRITLFNGAELFEKLVEGPDEALAYLENIKKDKQEKL